MPRVLLKKGLRFTIHGDEYVIEKLLPNGDVQIQHLVEKKFLPVPKKNIVDALFKGHIKFHAESGSKSYKVPNHTPSVESLDLLDDTEESRKRKAEAKRRHKYVSVVKRLCITKFTQNRLQPVIDKVSVEIKDEKPPSWYTLGVWCKTYFSQGETRLVLVPLTNKRGNKTPKFGFKTEAIPPNEDAASKKTRLARMRRKAQEVEDIINDEHDASHLLREQPTVVTLYNRIEGRIRRINARRPEAEHLPIPVKSSIYERVGAMAGRETDEYRLGKMESDKLHRTSGRAPHATYPLERTQMDETLLPLMVVDTELFLPIGKPQTFANIDTFSGMPTGWNVDFYAPSYLGAMNCLIHTIEPKTYVKDSYPEIVHESPCHGIMDTQVFDNAKYFIGDSMEDAAKELEFNLDFSPVKMPWYKSHIEHFWHVIACELLSFMPGKTFSNLFSRRDYDPAKHAVISYETFIKLLHIYFIDIYPCEKHKFDGFEDVPLRRWMDAVESVPIPLPSKKEDLRVLVGEVVYRRSLTEKGVEIDGLFYNSNQLQEFRDRWLKKRKEGDLIKIKRPRKISTCYVADYETGKYIHVPATNEEYTRNLTKYQHKIIRRRARLMADKYVDAEALCKARDLVQRIVQEEWEKAKPGNTRVNHARFLDYGHEVRGEGIQEHKKSTDQEESIPAQNAPNVRLFPAASTSQGTSDVGSATPLFKPDTRGEPDDSQVRGSIIEDSDAKGSKSKKREKRAATGQHRGEADSPVSSKNAPNEDSVGAGSMEAGGGDGFDESGWGGDYN